MALKSFTKVDGLKDPLRQFQISLTLGPGVRTLSNAAARVADNITSTVNDKWLGGNFNLGSVMGVNGIFLQETFELRCTSFTYPGAKVNTTNLVLFNHAKNIPTYNDKSGVLSVEVVEDMDASVLTAINNWCDVIHNHVSGYMSSSEFYATNGMMDILDQNMHHTRRIYLHGVWPTNVSPIQINTSSSDAVKVKIDFNYDWYSEMNTFL